MEAIASEPWTAKQIEHHHCRGDKLVCKACVGAGKTRYNIEVHDCKACKEAKARSHFKGQDLKDQKKKVKAGETYTLVCLACKSREEDLTGKLDQLNAHTCRKCFAGSRWHKETCTATFKIRVTEDDLKFLTFRSQYIDRYRLKDAAYYMRLGVLNP